MNKTRTICAIITCFVIQLFCALPVGAGEEASALAACEGGFLYLNTEGHIIFSDPEGKETEFTAGTAEGEKPVMLKLFGERIYVGYDSGSIVCMDADGVQMDFWQLEGVPQDLLETEDGLLIAASTGIFRATQGSVQKEADFDSEVVGMASTTYAAIAAGEDGRLLVWTEDKEICRVDCSSYYGKDMTVTAVGAANNVLYVAGYDESRTPVLLYSTGGQSWTERKLAMLDEQSQVIPLDEIPLAIAYSEASEAVLVSCSGGKVAVLPSCVKCNAFYRLSEEADLTDLAVNGNTAAFLENGETLLLTDVDRIPSKENPEKDCEGGC